MSPNSTFYFEWYVYPDLCGSDHFLICIQLKTNILPDQPEIPKWKFGKTNWATYISECNIQLNEQTPLPFDDPMTFFSNSILAIANLSILKTSAFPRKVYKPWLSEECKKAINQ